MSKKRVVIIGAGPAGLSSAYSLLKSSDDYEVLILESDDCVGGISKTVKFADNGIDIGPHRFHTKNQEVMDLWTEFMLVQGAPAIDDLILNRNIDFLKDGADPQKVDNVFLKRRRFSRIYFENHFFDYPIKLKLSTVLSLGLLKTFNAGMSYLKSCFFKIPETNLESFMINRFGRILYETFFEDYTQKVWGVHPSQISKDWGAQRIKGISLLKVLINAILSPLHLVFKKESSLIDEYFYPKLGSSQMWEAMAQKIEQLGGKIIFNSTVCELHKNNDKIISVKIRNSKTNEVSEINGDIFISSMPIKDLIIGMNDVPEKIYQIADNLIYRSYILVGFVLKNLNLKNNTNYPTINNIAPDSWIYLQDTGVKAGRLDIMNNFSPYVIKDFDQNVVVALEYFCNENDDIWKNSDENIINTGLSELKNLNIVNEGDVLSSKVIRVKKAYPSYFAGYDKFDMIRNYLDNFSNLYCIGRNGQHKYNNMDHSVLSGIICAKVILQNLDTAVLWEVNTDSEYQENK